ncbi:MAG TPA: Hsp20/alpha crystallin family protein [Gammaproteobacteria bacterium]|nr:Hsp20/alpha crystallin family protein [Gammaproteobacteria bacterium]
MANLQPVREGLERAWSSLSDAWHQLRQRAAQALTRFTHKQAEGGLESAEQQVLRYASPWAVLAADVSATDQDVIVKLEVPGMEPEDFDIQVVDGLLVVSGEKHFSRERRNDQFYTMERAYGRFQRAVPLPVEVDDSQARARYRRGVLTVTLPKSARARSRRVEVRVD